MRLLLLTAFVAVFSFAAYALPMSVNSPTVSQSCTTTTARVEYGATNQRSIIVSNTGSVGVFVRSGDSTVEATTSHLFVAAGSVQTFTKVPGDTHIACITSSGSATIYVTTGSGE